MQMKQCLPTHMREKSSCLFSHLSLENFSGFQPRAKSKTFPFSCLICRPPLWLCAKLDISRLTTKFLSAKKIRLFFPRICGDCLSVGFQCRDPEGLQSIFMCDYPWIWLWRCVAGRRVWRVSSLSRGIFRNIPHDPSPASGWRSM